jgi:hypothetical protein
MDGLWAALSTIGIEQERGFGWCYKAKLNGKPIDCFFPEEQGGEYEEAEAELTLSDFSDDEVAL